MARIFDVSDNKSTNVALGSDENSGSFRAINQFRCTRFFAVVCAFAALTFLISTIVLATLLALKSKQNIQSSNHVPIGYSNFPYEALKWPKPSGSLYGQFKKAAIATDHGFCSEIGRNILFIGGNAIDATIGSLICIGVVNPQSSGLGGGFLMTIYNRTTGKCVTINAREAAPAASNRTMFVTNPSEATIGYKAIAIPSEIHGLWTAYRQFGSGKVSWKSLIQPSVDLAINGFPVSSNLAETLADEEEKILAEKSLRAVFVDPNTGKVYKEGDRLIRYSLGQTLEMIGNSADPSSLFYEGELATIIADEMKENGGIMTSDDLRNYKTIVEHEPLQIPLTPGNLVMCGPPPPSSFVVTQLIVSILAEFYGNADFINLNDPIVYQRLIEAEKFGYVHRSLLGDLPYVKDAQTLVKNMTNRLYAKQIKDLIKEDAQPLDYYTTNVRYQKSDHGTSHVSALDQYGNAVATTDTINLRLGALRVSPQLGIVWNNEMDDFSTPGMSNAFNIAPSEANFIEPGKRPMSSMSPVVIFDKKTGKVKMVVGASGGSFIISATAQTIIRALLFNQTVKEAVDAPRLHNQFLPHTTEYESAFPEEIINDLRYRKGQSMRGIKKQASTVQVIEASDDGFIYGNSDFRRKTSTYPAGF